MNRKVKFLWILYGMVLAVLFLLSSTDLIIKEEAAEVYPISVIIGDTSDENYVNFRKGMERAAIELNGDVSFITLYEKGSAVQQRELILRELADGAGALVVAPVEADLLCEMEQENRFPVPVILINGEYETVCELERSACFTFDYYGMGQRLGEEILKEFPQQKRVCILEEERTDMAGRLFSQGLQRALGLTGCEVLSIEEETDASESDGAAGEGKDDWERGFLEKITGGWTQKTVLAAADPGSLARAAQLLAEKEEASRWVEGLYGRGNTVLVLNYLDKGIIRGLCVTDDFSAGYLSVKAAVELAGNHPSEEESVGGRRCLESHYIRREDLRNEKYEKMLYPIE